MRDNMLKSNQFPQCPLDAAYLLGKKYNASDLARKLGLSPNVLGNKLNPDQEFHKLSLGEAIAITELTNDNGILEAWCHQRGGIFLSLPDVVTGDEELADQMMKLNEALGSAMCELRTARQDGVIDPFEFERIKAELLITIHEALALKTMIKNQVREIPPSVTGFN